MKKLLLVILFIMMSGIAFAQTTSTTFGNNTYYSGDNRGSSTTYGNSTYYHINGQSGTATTIGGTTYYSGPLFNNNK